MHSAQSGSIGMRPFTHGSANTVPPDERTTPLLVRCKALKPIVALAAATAVTVLPGVDGSQSDATLSSGEAKRTNQRPTGSIGI